MARKLKYISITFVSMVVFLAITNPSQKQFKEFTGEPVFEDYLITYKRTSNWLVFSTYEFSYSNISPYSKLINEQDALFKANDDKIIGRLNKLSGKYTGFILNFYKN